MPVTSSDLHTLGVKYSDSAGSMRLQPLAGSTGMLSEIVFVDQPSQRPWTLRGLLDAEVASDTAPLRRHHGRRSVLQLGPGDEGAEEHEFIESAHSRAQLGVTGLASFEHISRRHLFWKESCTSSRRDCMGALGSGFGLDERSFLRGLTSLQMVLVSAELSTWISGRMGETSAILEERRKGREEQWRAAG